MRGVSVFLIGLAAACAACQLLLPDRDDAPAADPSAAALPCGLRPEVFRQDLEGASSLLVSDDEGAYFNEDDGTDGGKRIASMTALRDGGLAFKSLATWPGDNVSLLWADPSTPGRLWYVASSPGGLFFKFVEKSLATLDPNYIAAPDPILRFGAARRLFLVIGGPPPGVRVGAATTNVGYGLDEFGKLPTLEPSAVLGVTGDTDVFVASSTAIIKVVHGGSIDYLFQAADGGAGPQGPIAARAGVVYFIAGNDVWSVSANGGTATPLGAHMNARALAVDDECVYFATDTALMAFERSGGPPRVVAQLATKLFELNASPIGVFWTTGGVAPRVFAMLRPIPQ